MCAWAALAPQGEVPPALERVYQRDSYQRVLPLPGGSPAGGSGKVDWRTDRDRAPREGRGPIEAPSDEPREPVRNRLRGIGTAASAFLTIAAVAFVVIVVVALVLAARGWKRPAADSEPPPNVARIEPVEPPETASTGSDVPDAEALARAGRFGEAIHALLLRALDLVVRKTGTELPTASTSREVLRTAKLPEEMRAPLRVLVQGTERAVFARDPLGSRDFEFCRDAFTRLGAAAA